MYRSGMAQSLGCYFAAWLGYSKDHQNNGTNCLPAWQAAIRVGVWQSSLTVKKAWKCVELSIDGDPHHVDLLDQS